MKIRIGFVTNSSSSSYLILYRIKDKDKLREHISTEFGRKGLAEFDKANTNAIQQAEDFYTDCELFVPYHNYSAFENITDEEVHELFMKKLAELGIDPAGEYAMYTEDWDYGGTSLIEIIMKSVAKGFTSGRFQHDQFRVREGNDED